MNTYIIIIPDCTHPYARHDFESDDWRSTNDLSKAWTVDEATADEAAYNFRETFGIDQGSFTISATLLSEAIEDQAAYVLNVLTYSQEAGGIVIKTCDTKATGELIIPATIGGLPVTRIASWAFAGCSGLTRVVIPNSVTSVGFNAFRYCLATITPPIFTPIENLKLSMRTGIALWNNFYEISSIGDLASKTEKELLRFRGVGKKRLNEIKEKLGFFGLKLASEPPV